MSKIEKLTIFFSVTINFQIFTIINKKKEEIVELSWIYYVLFPSSSLSELEYARFNLLWPVTWLWFLTNCKGASIVSGRLEKSVLVTVVSECSAEMFLSRMGVLIGTKAQGIIVDSTICLCRGSAKNTIYMFIATINTPVKWELHGKNGWKSAGANF